MSSQDKFEEDQIKDETGSQSEGADHGSDDSERTLSSSGKESELDVAGHKFLLDGQVIGGKYRIVSKLGSGGMSVVYKANDMVIDRVVAVKTLWSSKINDEKSVRRFQQEGKAVGRLNHPSIVCVHDFGVTESGEPFLVMDYAEGTTLAETLGLAGRIEPLRSLDIVQGVLDALIHAHEKGVVHRDLKPGNIIVSANLDGKEHVRVFDFGIAKLMPEGDKPSSDLTQTGEVFGSPLYMSPEQCLGKSLDGRSDIYSLGCILFELISGYPPHRAPTSVETIIKHVQDNPETLSQACRDLLLPEGLDALVTRALQKDPDLRFQTALEMKRSVSQLVEELKSSHLLKRVKAHSGFLPKLSQRGPKSLILPGSVILLFVFLAGLLCWLIAGTPEPAKAPDIRSEIGLGTLADMTDEAGVQTQVEVAPQELSPLPVRNGVLTLGEVTIQLDDRIAARIAKTTNFQNLCLNGCMIRPRTTNLKFFDKLEIETLSLVDAKFDFEFLRHVCSIPTLRSLDLSNVSQGREEMEIVACCSDLENLILSRVILSDAALEPVKRLSKLKYLSLSGCRVTDKSMDTILHCKHLQRLDLSNVSLSSQALKRLSRLKQLAKLAIAGRQTNDSQLSAIAALTGLEELDISDSQITDEGLIKLAGLRNLKKLRLTGCTSVSNAGIKRLEGTLPNCELVRHVDPGLKVI